MVKPDMSNYVLVVKGIEVSDTEIAAYKEVMLRSGYRIREKCIELGIDYDSYLDDPDYLNPNPESELGKRVHAVIDKINEDSGAHIFRQAEIVRKEYGIGRQRMKDVLIALGSNQAWGRDFI